MLTKIFKKKKKNKTPRSITNESWLIKEFALVWIHWEDISNT